jgi:hypothetical protein
MDFHVLTSTSAKLTTAAVRWLRVWTVTTPEAHARAGPVQRVTKATGKCAITWGCVRTTMGVVIRRLRALKFQVCNYYSGC